MRSIIHGALRCFRFGWVRNQNLFQAASIGDDGPLLLQVSFSAFWKRQRLQCVHTWTPLLALFYFFEWILCIRCLINCGPFALLPSNDKDNDTTCSYALNSVLAGLTFLHDEVFRLPAATSSESIFSAVGTFLLAYYVLLFTFRITESGSYIIYDTCWACNISLLVAAYAYITDRPSLATAVLINISIDQFMWYIDVAGYLFTRKWPIGVASYLLW